MIYIIDGRQADSASQDFESILQTAYEKRQRPSCTCTGGGVEMYIAKISDSYHIKRMPGTGSKHYFRCVSYAPPAELSGLGELMGSAIREEPEKDSTLLKFGFSLSKGAGRPAPEIGEPTGTAGEAKSDTSKLSMRALMHYLLDQAGITCFEEKFAGKRSWHYFRKAMLDAAHNKSTKSESLSKILFMPETFSLERKDEIAARRKSALFPAMNTGRGKQSLMVIIGKVTGFSVNKYGGWLVKFKHLPDFRFKITDDLYKRLSKTYAFEIGAWEESPDSLNLMMMGTFFMEIGGYPRIETATLLIADENWIPFESGSEMYVMQSLNELGRSYIKGLRYDLKYAVPFASFMLTDTEDATALYIEDSKGNETYKERLQLQLENTKLGKWVWREDSDSMPELPEPAQIP